MKTKTKIFTRQLFRSLILLLLMTGWSHCAWAETETKVIFSMVSPTAPTEKLNQNEEKEVTATISGGRAYVCNKKSTATSMLSNNSINLAGSSNSYLKITLNQELREGDIIDIGNTETEAFILNKEATNGQSYTFPLTVTSDFAGTKALYFRKSKAKTISKVTIERTSQSRTFKDFELNFVNATEVPATPEGVTSMTGEVRKDVHGLNNFQMVLPVDGPVLFTFGGCEYSNTKAIVKNGEEVLAEIDIKTPGCYHDGGKTTWKYNSEEPATLTIIGGEYTSYIKAEACEYVPEVTVNYYDTDGKTLIESEVVAGSSSLTYKFGADNVSVGEGKKFRGWFNSSGFKVAEGTTLSSDLNLYAKATEIEVPDHGKTFDYDLRQSNFYPEDHEGLTISNGKFHDGQHGFSFSGTNALSVHVAGNATLTTIQCQYTNPITITDSKTQKEIGKITKDGTTDNKVLTFTYNGPATTLQFSSTGTFYLHNLKVENLPLEDPQMTITPGKETIIFKNDAETKTYQITKGTDFTDKFSDEDGAYIYKSSNEDIATVDENGLVTAGRNLGSAIITVSHAGNDTYSPAEIKFTVYVGEPTNKPSVKVKDKTITITKEQGARYYYTTDGSNPSVKADGTGEGTTKEATDATITAKDNQIVKIIATKENQSPSEAVKVYVNVTATLTWPWNTAGTPQKEPTVGRQDIRDILDKSTLATWGNKLDQSFVNNGEVLGVGFTPTGGKAVVEPDEESVLAFNIIPVNGISFKPTSVGFKAGRSATSSGLMDVKIASESNTYTLLESELPTLDKMQEYNGDYKTQFSSIQGAAEEWALKFYIYTLTKEKKWAFSDIAISGTFSGVETDGTFYTISATTIPDEGGTVYRTPSASRVVEGHTVKLKAVPNDGYRFVNWIDDDKTVHGSDKELNVTMERDITYEANFEKLPKVTFENNNTEVITGKVPEADYVGEDFKFTIPQNTTLYREGYAVVAWKDKNSSDEYLIGQKYEFKSDITLIPVMKKSQKAITDTDNKLVAKWYFDQKDGAPEITETDTNKDNIFEYTTSVTIEDTVKIDLPMYLTGAKAVNNDARVNFLKDRNNRPAKGGQLNNNITLRIPAVYGMKVMMKASEKVDNENPNKVNETFFAQPSTGNQVSNLADLSFLETANGTALSTEGNVKKTERTLTYTYKGDAKELIVKVTNAGSQSSYGFFEYLEVTYPVLPDVKWENKIVSKALADRKEDPDKACKEVTVKRANANAETNAEGNTGKRYKPGESVTITATPGYGYTIQDIKNGETSLKATESGQNTETETETATFTVPDTTTTLTVEYKRKPMAKVRLRTADKTLGTVDFEKDDIHDNFYMKNEEEGIVESYFVAGDKISASSDAADEYVLSKWTKGSLNGNEASTSAVYELTVPAEGEVDYYAHFVKGKSGTVRFRLQDEEGNWLAKLKKENGTYDENPLKLDEKSKAPEDRVNCGSFYIPNYYTIFKTYDAQADQHGWKLVYWIDNKDKRYDIGKNYAFANEGEEITLIPVFEENPTGMNNRLNEPIITYEFGTVKGIRAQKLDLPKNTDLYYSGKVDVEIMQEGKPNNHTRDVALWINTGEKGYVRNEGLDEWAAMGPGTTLQIVSCAGTKIEIYSYSPITSTTIDGHVPTEFKKTDDGYIYSYTTNSTNPRVPIVIGNDYSYYKWVKAYTRMASRVDLHVSVENKDQGGIVSVETTEKEGVGINEKNPPIIDLEDGGKSLIQGDRAIVKFERKFGYVFDKIIDPDKIVNGEPLAVLEMKDDGSAQMVDFNDARYTVDVKKNADGSWGIVTGEGKTVFVLTQQEPTEEEKAAGKRTQYKVEFDITTHRNLVFCFKEKPTYYVTFNAGQQATGTAPSAIWLEQGDKFQIPLNRTLYYSGHTLSHWTDSKGNTYTLNQTCTLKDNWGTDQNEDYNLRLTPVFEKNKFTLFDQDLDKTKYTATWDFRRSQGAPNLSVERSTGILITQLYKDNDTFIDWKIELDASDYKDDKGDLQKKGKFNNLNNDDRCQINAKSILKFPVNKGSKIKLSATNDIKETEIAGITNYTPGKEVTVDYNGDENVGVINFQSDGKYYHYLSVTYTPQNLVKPELGGVKIGETPLTDEQLAQMKSEADHKIDYKYSPIKLNADGEELRDDKGFVIEKIDSVKANVKTAGNGYVEVDQPTIENPKANIRLYTNGGSLLDSYEIDFKLTAPDGKKPQFMYFVINGDTIRNEKEVTINDMPPSGYFKIVFDRTMQEKTIPFKGNASSTSEKRRDLTFYYWDMVDVKDLTVACPVKDSNDTEKYYFTDIYGNGYDVKYKDISIYGQTIAASFVMHFNTRSTMKEIKHRKFDFIVGEDGTLAEAIELANNNKDSDAKRYFIYVPDGEYKLEGNEPLTNYGITSDGKWPCDEKGQPVTDMQGQNNGMTMIRRPKVSLIGQSRDGVTIWNKPRVEGIGYTATLHIAKDNDGRASDFYAQDISLENRFDYWGCVNGGSSAARAVAFWDQGQRTTMKNVSMMSWQDTYYSSNASADYHGYFEDCRLGGIIDWACGDGNIWFENCDIVIRDRSGNNFAAPSQEKDQLWGYIFSNCQFTPEHPLEEMTNLKDKTWTLARPWANDEKKSPACVFLNTAMHVLPKDFGWGSMNSNSVLRFQEYHSTDGNGTLLSLGARSLAASNPAAGSYDCVLNDADAAKFTVRNVMSGTEAYDPVERTKQIDAKSGMPKTPNDANDIETADQTSVNRTEWDDKIEIDDDRLQWNCENTALCYFVFKLEGGKWMYKAQVVQDEGAEKAGISLDQNNLGAGTYCVRAANQYGGLGTPTESIVFTNPQRYTLTLKQLGDLTVDDKPYGYSTICLDYNAKAPEGATVYAVTAQNKHNETDKVTTYYVTLKTVDLLTANKGYVVYGPAGEYVFKSTSHSDDTPTILRGNPSNSEISSVNNNCYVLANKSFGLGFYKYTGATLRAHLGWLPADMVDTNVNYGTASGAKGIRFSFSDGSDLPTGLRHLLHGSSGDDRLYNISGQRIRKPAPRTIYITPGKGKAVAK